MLGGIQKMVSYCGGIDSAWKLHTMMSLDVLVGEPWAGVALNSGQEGCDEHYKFA